MTLVVVCLAVGAITLFVWYRRQEGRPLSQAAADRLLRIAVDDADRGRLDYADTHLRRILTDCPEHHLARRMLAEICVKMRRPHEAAAIIAALPDESLGKQFQESLALAKSLASSGFLFEAEPLLQRLIAIRPDQLAVGKELLRCFRISGRNAAAASLLASALHERQLELGDLLMITATGRLWASNSDIQFMQQTGHNHDDPLVMTGRARREIEKGQLSTGVSVLQRTLVEQPGWQLAATRLAIANWLLGRDDEWRQAMSDWDPATLNDADGWFVWGVWHRQHKQVETAARCFCEALLRDPKHVGACSLLVTTLRELGFESEPIRLKAIADRMSKIELYCIDVGFKVKPEGVRAIAVECDAVGWHAESRAWNRYGKQTWKQLDWPGQLEEEGGEPGFVTSDNGGPLNRLVLALDFRRYPLPTRFTQVVKPTLRDKIAHIAASSWQLDDEAASLGVEFRFSNGLDPNRKRAYMFEFSGPGIGVLDYDRDGWPDLHLTQGAPWPVQAGNTSIRDELFRNMGDGRFTPVADAAHLGEPNYSQGSAVGDLDSDGFPDVYVCNIGPNRCYRNNGDGTFSEITAATGMAGDDWSLSAAWADFNDDGLPDLYVVNYLTGDVFERACVGDGGRPVQCAPTFFPAADDRLYLNHGDGTFQDISAEAEILIPHGKGMGVAVGRLQDSRQVGVFVANDTTANYLLARKAEAATIPRFEEIGSVVGVAFGPNGSAQSSMGVAAGDVNGDGRLDLFVTNFVHESSNLFVQGPGGLFEDVASQFGLSSGGFRTEGWGAQFLDVDADGHLDLFVANGHLDEKASGLGRMPPHLFRNRGGKKLDLVSSPAVGRYFDGKYLGRSVAVWDWNRDGREDLCVSHVSDPVAILTNRTQDPGHCLSLRLVGVRASRDPIGAQVTLTSGGRTLVRELVAGDGYAASNERRLYFGLDTSTDQVDVAVDWAGGVVQCFSGMAVDAEYVLIEGRPTPVQLWRYGGMAVTGAE